jgi:DNA-binding transcriptional MerR regulator
MTELGLLIREASQVVGVHENSLRRYEQRGLIRPKRDINGWRRYQLTDLLALKKLLNSPPESRN